MSLRKIFFNKYVLLALVAVGAYLGYTEWNQAHKEPLEKKFKFHPVAVGDVTQTVSANGTLNPVVMVAVGTQVSGTVTHWYADFNDHVQKGQVLMELDPSLFKSQVDMDLGNVHSAEAALELAKANEGRIRKLLAEKYATQADLETATATLKGNAAALEVAKAQLDRDRTNLNYSVIRSPVSGVVVSRQIDVGQTVAASFQTPTLYTIAQDLHKMQIDSSYAEADIGGIRVGQPARFTVDAHPNRVFTGTVRQIRINPTTQSNVVTYDIVVNVQNDDEALLPGMTAYVNIIVAQKNGVLLVPNAALRFKPPSKEKKPGAAPGKSAVPAQEKDEKRAGGNGTVYVLENEAFRRIKIGLGITDNKMTEVVSGDLKAGDNIVVEELAPSDSGETGSFSMRMF